ALPRRAVRQRTCARGSRAVAETLERRVAALPVEGDLHVQFDEDVVAEHRFDLASRPRADLFQHLSTAADHDALLIITFDIRRRMDRLVVDLVDEHCYRMRNFFARQLERLLTYQLCDRARR